MEKKGRLKDRRIAQKDVSFHNRRRFDRRLNIDDFKKLLFSAKKERIPGKSRVVITGIGVVAPNGVGKDQFWDNLSKGVSGVRPISTFNVDKYNSKTAGEIVDFDATHYLGKKGLRSLDRSTILIDTATKLALNDSGITITEKNTYDMGVVVGTTMGSVSSISEFDKSGLIDGPSYVNPSFFPNTVINSPASHASIMFDIRGLNATISNGYCSALTAAVYAYDSINLNKISTVFVGAVEEFCKHTFLGFYKAGCLASANSKQKLIEQSVPFDKRRNGLVLGEGAGVVVFEELEHAVERKAIIYGEVLGFAKTYDPDQNSNKYHLKVDGTVRAMQQALKMSNLSTESVDLICASANSTKMIDLIETKAVKKVFSKKAASIPITAVKSMLGEGYSVSGNLQMIAALLAINKGIIPPTLNYQEKDTYCNLDYVPNKCRNAKVNKVMINSISPNGNSVSFIIGKCLIHH
ncbi:MAG: beta-ketoacyl-[acyl-carrier-protein] synthase family protein [bacterium]